MSFAPKPAGRARLGAALRHAASVLVTLTLAFLAFWLVSKLDNRPGAMFDGAGLLALLVGWVPGIGA